jgi:hypothetical protein
MPYGTQADVEFFGQFTESSFGQTEPPGLNYKSMIERALFFASSRIDAHCRQPKDYFIEGGIQIADEIHDGVQVGHYGVYATFGTRRRPKLRLNYSPVLAIISLEHMDSSGTWTTKTSGRSQDYLNDEQGIIYFRSLPTYDRRNIRINYKVGYQETPILIHELASRIGAQMIRTIIDSEESGSYTVGNVSIKITATLADQVFSPEMRQDLGPYMRTIPLRLVNL